MSFNPDRINIHELTIEEPEKQVELPFDVERDITKEDWEMINNELKERDKYGDWQTSELAVAANILSRSLSENAPNTTEALKGILQGCRNQNSWSRFAGHAAKFKILAPEQADEIKVTSLEKIHMENELLNKIGPYSGTLNDKVGFKIIFPEADFRGLLNSEDYEQLSEHWQEEKESVGIRTVSLPKSPFDFFEKTAQLRLLGFEFTENIKFTQEQWEYINGLLSGLRADASGYKGNYYKLCQFAADLKIITAKRVEVTDKGIEVEMPKKKDALTSETPPVPEIKKF
jgi:hypothetical protein